MSIPLLQADPQRRRSRELKRGWFCVPVRGVEEAPDWFLIVPLAAVFGVLFAATLGTNSSPSQVF